MRKKLTLVVGARPNFIKAAPLMKALLGTSELFEPSLIHTGQHYDHNLSTLFFDELKMPRPDRFLGVGSGTQAEQTARIMVEFEKAILEINPDMVLVFGDVNSTMAASIVAAKLHIPVAHVEAGLRSFDTRMPEEINRIVTDRIADYLFVSEESGYKNLLREGVSEEKLTFVGNIMIDSLVANLEVSRKSSILQKLGLVDGQYGVLTLHRPSNVDDGTILRDLLMGITEIGEITPIVFPCHPRTQKELEKSDLKERIDSGALHIIEPLGYLDFLRLQSTAKFVITDSGGVQEETTFLGIPCITVRENTERPSTVELGTNALAGNDPLVIKALVQKALEGSFKKGTIPPMWDGHTADRIVTALIGLLHPDQTTAANRVVQVEERY